MRIGILGCGQVGGALGRGWGEKGHAIFYGSRNPETAEVRALVAASGRGARAGSPAQANAASDVLLLAVPWSAVSETLKAAGDLSGKVLLDATNPLTPGPGGLGLCVPGTTSGGEQVAAWAKGAHVVKVFNSVGTEVMRNPRVGGAPASMLYCGDDPAARDVAGRLAADLGFEPVDLGPLVESRVLEPFALLWIHLAVVRGYGREIAFRLLRP